MKVQLIKICEGQLTTYNDYLQELMNPSKGMRYDISKEDNNAKGKFSKKSKNRFVKIIKNLVSVYEIDRLNHYCTRSYYNRKMIFVTLTLSQQQFSSDPFIRRNMLNSFLRTIKEKHNVTSYLYCSEAQKNGNIHFHIIINKFINYLTVRGIWNSIQKSYGYMEDYYNEHKTYDANSTDIHSLTSINHIEAYLIKYFTKDQNRRKIYGHLWGCSDNLRKLEMFELVVEDEIIELLNYIFINRKKDVYCSEYFNVFSNVSFNFIRTRFPILYEKISKHYEKQMLLL